MIDVGKLGQGKKLLVSHKSVDSARTLYFSNVLTLTGRGEKGLDLNNIFMWEKLGLSTPFTPQHPITCCSWGLTSDSLLFPTNNKKVFLGGWRRKDGERRPIAAVVRFFCWAGRPNHTKEAPRQSIIYFLCPTNSDGCTLRQFCIVTTEPRLPEALPH